MPRASKTGVDLVRNQQPAFSVADRPEFGQETVRRDAFATPSLDGLDDHRAHCGAAGAGGAAHILRFSKARERRQPRKPRRKRLAEHWPPGHVARAKAQAVVRAFECHHTRSAAGKQRRFECHLYRVGTRRSQDRPGRCATRKMTHERFEQFESDR